MKRKKIRWIIKIYFQGTHDGGAHAKFANYYFNKADFVEIVEQAASYVKEQNEFKKLIKKTTHDEL